MLQLSAYYTFRIINVIVISLVITRPQSIQHKSKTFELGLNLAKIINLDLSGYMSGLFIFSNRHEFFKSLTLECLIALDPDY